MRNSLRRSVFMELHERVVLLANAMGTQSCQQDVADNRIVRDVVSTAFVTEPTPTINHNNSSSNRNRVGWRMAPNDLYVRHSSAPLPK